MNPFEILLDQANNPRIEYTINYGIEINIAYDITTDEPGHFEFIMPTRGRIETINQPHFQTLPGALMLFKGILCKNGVQPFTIELCHRGLHRYEHANNIVTYAGKQFPLPELTKPLLSYDVAPEDLQNS